MSSLGATAAACHACGHAAITPVPGFEALPRVSSDCRPQPAGGRLAVCETCGLVQAVVDPAWRRETAAIYDNYAVYHQGGGAEQAVFTTRPGEAQPRSRRLVARLLDTIHLPATGRALDVGCGNGGFLRALTEQRPRWTLAGTELDERNRAAVTAIPRVEAFHATADPGVISGVYDLVSLIHVLEHIVDPAAFLDRLRPRLGEGGHLLIQVPYFPHNPFELLIADHSSHFTPDTLARLLGCAGMRPIVTSVDWVAKELSVVACLAATTAAPGEAPAAGALEAATAAVAWLSRVFQQARALGACRRLGLFGTSIAASALAGALGDAIAFYMDEDPARVGGRHLGRPILTPAQAPPESDILIALPTPIARAVVQRLPDGLRIHLPPELPSAPAVTDHG